MPMPGSDGTGFHSPGLGVRAWRHRRIWAATDPRGCDRPGTHARMYKMGRVQVGADTHQGTWQLRKPSLPYPQVNNLPIIYIMSSIVDLDVWRTFPKDQTQIEHTASETVSTAIRRFLIST